MRVLRHRDDEVRRRYRRSRCGRCSLTHVLLAEYCLLRRRDAVGVIGAALAAKAARHGHRPIARGLGRLAPTVRNWLRRLAARAGGIRTRVPMGRPEPDEPGFDSGRRDGGGCFAERLAAR